MAIAVLLWWLECSRFWSCKSAWRVWNNALSSEDYLKYYFVFSRYPLNRRLMPHDHSIDSKGGLMNIVIDVRRFRDTTSEARRDVWM